MGGRERRRKEGRKGRGKERGVREQGKHNIFLFKYYKIICNICLKSKRKNI